MEYVKDRVREGTLKWKNEHMEVAVRRNAVKKKMRDLKGKSNRKRW